MEPQFNEETVGTGKPVEENPQASGIGQMPFSDAMKEINNGQPMTRAKWISPSGDINYFVFKQVPSLVPKAVIPKMSSLPDKVKSIFERKIENKESYRWTSLLRPILCCRYDK